MRKSEKERSSWRFRVAMWLALLGVFGFAACGGGSETMSSSGNGDDDRCSPSDPPTCDGDAEIRCEGDPPTEVKYPCPGDNQFCKEGVGCTCNLSECALGQKPICDGVAAVNVCGTVGTCDMWIQAPGPTCAERNMVCKDGVCFNECGGTFQLFAHDCDPDPAHAPCGVLRCDPEGSGNLVSDHLDCRLGQVYCDVDEQCASCICQNHVCIGDTPLHCPIAANCP